MSSGPAASGNGIGAGVGQLISLLKETQSLLKIEDVLPYFPDHVQIGTFKDEICASLESYNKQVCISFVCLAFPMCSWMFTLAFSAAWLSLSLLHTYTHSLAD